MAILLLSFLGSLWLFGAWDIQSHYWWQRRKRTCTSELLQQRLITTATNLWKIPIIQLRYQRKTSWSVTTKPPWATRVPDRLIAADTLRIPLTSLCLIFTSMEESPCTVVCCLLPVLWSCIDENCPDNICMVQDQSVVIKSRHIYVGRGNFLPQLPLLETLSLLHVLGKAWEWKKEEALSRAGLDC